MWQSRSLESERNNQADKACKQEIYTIIISLFIMCKLIAYIDQKIVVPSPISI